MRKAKEARIWGRLLADQPASHTLEPIAHDVENELVGYISPETGQLLDTKHSDKKRTDPSPTVRWEEPLEV